MKRLGLCLLLSGLLMYSACASPTLISIEQQMAIPLATKEPVKKSAAQQETAMPSLDVQSKDAATAQATHAAELPSVTPVQAKSDAIAPFKSTDDAEQEKKQGIAAAETVTLPNATTAEGGNAPDLNYINLVISELGLTDTIEHYEISVTHQSDELISCLVELKIGNSSTLVPYTYSLRQQRVCRLGDFFSKTNTGWKSLLPDLVTKEALAQGMILLCDVPPVTESHPFYILDNSIVLLYRPYEITTYEAGSPQFVINMQEIKEYTTGAFGIGYAS